jgi:membrane protein
MSRLQSLRERADRLQQRHPWLGFPAAALVKFRDDEAGNLAALIAYYAFVSIFPLLLILLTVLDLVLDSHPALREHVVNSALANYPVFAPELESNVHAAGSAATGLTVGLVGLAIGTRKLAAATQHALNTAWAVPRHQRPGEVSSLLRSLGLIVLVGPGEIVTSLLSGLAAGHVLSGAGARVVAIAVSLVLDTLLFWLAFRLATAVPVSTRDLRLSAVITAVAWQILQVAGGYLIAHQLARRSVLYGVFAIVLGLLAWLYLQAQVALYAVELSVIRVHRLWPRSLFPPPATEADRRAARLAAGGDPPSSGSRPSA